MVELHESPDFIKSVNSIMPDYGWRRAGDTPVDAYERYISTENWSVQDRFPVYHRLEKTQLLDSEYFGVSPELIITEVGKLLESRED